MLLAGVRNVGAFVALMYLNRGKIESKEIFTGIFNTLSSLGVVVVIPTQSSLWIVPLHLGATTALLFEPQEVINWSWFYKKPCRLRVY